MNIVSVSRIKDVEKSMTTTTVQSCIWYLVALPRKKLLMGYMVKEVGATDKISLSMVNCVGGFMTYDATSEFIEDCN